MRWQVSLSTLTPLGKDIYLLSGRDRVLRLAPVLRGLARRTGQLGAMHWLEYFFEAPSFASKPPYLVLRLSDPTSAHQPAEQLTAEHVVAAALFFEYRVLGFRTGVFSTDDAVGFRTVIAAPRERARFAEHAAQALLQHGASMVLTTYDHQPHAAIEPQPVPGALLGYRERSVGRMLSLAPTYEETLAQMGRLTRRNLRYYRRQLASRMELSFVEDICPYITFEDFKALNDSSLNPVRDEKELRLRWRCSCELEGSYIAGLRTADGQWLSLIGGWRQDTTTILHWQLNSAGYERDSIGIVMRSFFLENEIARGARNLLMFGGTPHSIRHTFRKDTIVDLVLCRPTLVFRCFQALARQLTARSRFASTNHLLQTLAMIPLRTPAPSFVQVSPAIDAPAAARPQAG